MCTKLSNTLTLLVLVIVFFFSCTPPDVPSEQLVEVGQIRHIDYPKLTKDVNTNVRRCTSYFNNPIDCSLDSFIYDCPPLGPIMHVVTTGKFGFVGISNWAISSEDSEGILPGTDDMVTLVGDFYISIPCKHVPEAEDGYITYPGDGAISQEGIPLYEGRDSFNGEEVPPILMELKIFKNNIEQKLSDGFSVKYSKVKIEYDINYDLTTGNYESISPTFDKSITEGSTILPSDYSFVCIDYDGNSKECAAILNVVVTYKMPKEAASKSGFDTYTLTLEAVDLNNNNSMFHEDNSNHQHNTGQNNNSRSIVQQAMIKPACENIDRKYLSFYKCVDRDTNYHYADHIAIVQLPYHKEQKAKPGGPSKLTVQKIPNN